MKWPVHEHDLFGSSSSRHTEGRLLVSLVTALFYSVISFASSLLPVNFPSLSPSVFPGSASVLCLLSSCPLSALFFFFSLQHNSLQFVLMWQTVSARLFLLPSSAEASFQDTHSGEKLPDFISYSLLLLSPISPSIFLFDSQMPSLSSLSTDLQQLLLPFSPSLQLSPSGNNHRGVNSNNTPAEMFLAWTNK